MGLLSSRAPCPMNLDKTLPSHLAAILFLLACTGSTTTPPPSAPPADDTGDKTETVREALDFIAPCTASVCGEIPPSAKSSRPRCRSSAGACAWSDPPSPDDSVSYRACEESECGPKPDASVCPSGTTYKGAACGSENEGPCTWRTTCVPPPSTTPCEDAYGCGPKPELAVVCKDGSVGDLLCMKQGTRCDWQRSCE